MQIESHGSQTSVSKFLLFAQEVEQRHALFIKFILPLLDIRYIFLNMNVCES